MASVALKLAVGSVALGGNGVSHVVALPAGVSAAPLAAPDASGGALHPAASLYPSASVWPGFGGLPAVNVVGSIVFADRTSSVFLAPTTANVTLQSTT